MRSSIFSPIFLILSLSTLLVHATRGLNPIYGANHNRWMSYDQSHGFFYGKYQVSKDLSPKEMASVLKAAAGDLMQQIANPSVEAPGVTTVPFAIAAYMGEGGIFALASSTGKGKHAEENLAAALGSHYHGGESLAILMPGGNSGVQVATLMGACKNICTPLLKSKDIKDVFPTVKRRSFARRELSAEDDEE